jgi:hypothetical protein
MTGLRQFRYWLKQCQANDLAAIPVKITTALRSVQTRVVNEPAGARS